MRAKKWLIGASVVVWGVTSLAIAAVEGPEDSGSSIAVWTFLGLCAVIVVGQLLPAFRAMRPPEKITESKLAEATAVNSGHQEKHDNVPDKEN